MRHLLRCWQASLIQLLLVAWVTLGLCTAPALAAKPPTSSVPAETIDIALNIGNVQRFSARDKTYSIEGNLRLSMPESMARRLQSSGVDPVEMMRFANQVDAWNSLLKPVGIETKAGSRIKRDYYFSGNFYSDEIDYHNYPFGTLPLQLRVVPVISANGAIRVFPFDPRVPSGINSLPEIRLQGNSRDSGVSIQTNMSGYRLKGWRLINKNGGVEMHLLYIPIGFASLVKWLLPLAITMVVMLLTPNLRSSFSSERLAIPPVILLTLVFMQQAYRESLPSLPYLTTLDDLYAFSYLVTLLFFCEFIWCANRLDQLDHPSRASLQRRFDRLETFFQIFSLAGYATLIIWAICNR